MLELAAFIVVLLILLHGGYGLSRRLPPGLRMAVPVAVLAGLGGLGLRLLVQRLVADAPFAARQLELGLLLPGLLLLPVLAATAVGDPARDPAGGRQTRSAVVGIMVAAGVALFGAQVAIGGLLAAGFAAAVPDLPIYGTFGLELVVGFFGGHATAGLIGSLLHGAGSPDWALAQALAVSYASLGLILGVATGLGAVALHRRGRGAGGARAQSAAAEAAVAEAPPRSLAHLGATLLFVLASCAAALGLHDVAVRIGVPVLGRVPIWILGLVLTRLLWLWLRRYPPARLVDLASRDRIAGYASDLAVVAALVSLPIERLGAYAVPILTIAACGLAGTALLLAILARWAFRDARFARAMMIYGTATGVYLTGLLLLKATDQGLRSPVLRDAAYAYPVLAVGSITVMPVLAAIGLERGPLEIGLAGAAICALGVLACAGLRRAEGRA